MFARAQLGSDPTATVADPTPPPAPGPTPLECLRAALEGQAPALLLVAAHNTLHALKSRYLPKPPATHQRQHQARQHLAADLVALAAHRPACQVRAIFDGPAASEHAPAPNVTISYSGGEGSDRADHRLIAAIRRLRRTLTDHRLILVTNDLTLAAKAQRLGARTLPPHKLAQLFGENHVN